MNQINQEVDAREISDQEIKDVLTYLQKANVQFGTVSWKIDNALSRLDSNESAVIRSFYLNDEAASQVTLEHNLTEGEVNNIRESGLRHFAQMIGQTTDQAEKLLSLQRFFKEDCPLEKVKSFKSP